MYKWDSEGVSERRSWTLPYVEDRYKTHKNMVV